MMGSGFWVLGFGREKHQVGIASQQKLGLPFSPTTKNRKLKTMTWALMGPVIFLALACGAPAKLGPDLRNNAMELNAAGYEYYRRSRWSLAEQKFTRALELNRLIDHRPGIAANLNNLGVLAQEQGDLARAETYYREALSIQQELGDPAGLCEALNNVGTVYQGKGDLRQAQEYYQKARAWAEMLPPGPLLALSLTHFGDLARRQGDLQGALTYYHQALEIDQAKKDRLGQARRFERLGRTYLVMGAYGQASQYLQESLQEFRRQESTNGIIDTLDGLTRLALSQGERAQARDYGERLRKIYQTRGQDREIRRLEALLNGKEDPPKP
jgi:tetratricopeptide (TPR) repeat protein